MGLTVPPAPQARDGSVTCAYCKRQRDASAYECPGCGSQQVEQRAEQHVVAPDYIEVTTFSDRFVRTIPAWR